MQLSINKPSVWFSPTAFKPFVLVGIATVSSVALYTPLSSQANELKSNISSNAIEPLSPFAKTGIEGAGKLFGTLGNWTKTVANTSETVNKWISEAANGNVPNGAKEIYRTLIEWAWKVYEFLKTLFDENAWERFKENMRHLSNFLRLFKNIMKAEIGGKASIFREILGAAGKEGFGEVASALGDLATKHPDIFDDMNEEETRDLAAAIKEDPQAMQKLMENFANKEEVSKKDLMNASKPTALMGRIRTALERSEQFKAKDELKTPEEKQAAKEVFEELGTLSEELNKLIDEVKKKQERK